MKYIRGLKKDIILSKYTTYKIGGPADYFFIAKSAEDLKMALKFADIQSWPVFVLAGGSNILFSDEGFRGLVIKIENQNIKIESERIIAGAGALMRDLVNKSVKAGLAGLEWAGGLPGTVGGAIRGNAGCFGGEIKDIVERVNALQFPISNFSPYGRSPEERSPCGRSPEGRQFSKNTELIELTNEDCQFNYRDSVFKYSKMIIWNAVLELKSGNKEKLKSEAFNHIKYRQEHHPLEFPNCGSIFKNCPLEMVPEAVQKEFMHKIKNDPLPILPTAVLIDAAGLKGKTIGGAKISEKHPNFIVNFKNARARDVLELTSAVKEKIKKEFNVNLQEEIELIGF